MNDLRRLVAPLVMLGLTAAACARLSDGDAGGGGIDHPTASDELILRLETGGGFLPEDYAYRTLPEFSLMGDGRIITVGPQIAIFPGPALPNLLVRRVSPEGIQAILARARDAGLFGPDAHYDFPLVADAATTTFTAVAAGRRHQVSAYALELEDEMVSPEDRRAREALRDLRDALFDLEGWLPAGSLSKEESFDLDELRIFAGPYQGAEEEGLEQEPVDWPLDEPLATFGREVPDRDVRCGTISGNDLDRLLPLLQQANELTPWMSDGSQYRLILRPLLPDESGC
jgi:hypothetical protein